MRRGTARPRRSAVGPTARTGTCQRAAGGPAAEPAALRFGQCYVVLFALSGPPELPDHEQHAEVADDVHFHVEDALFVGLAAVGDVEAAAVDGVVAEQIDGD